MQTHTWHSVTLRRTFCRTFLSTLSVTWQSVMARSDDTSVVAALHRSQESDTSWLGESADEASLPVGHRRWRDGDAITRSLYCATYCGKRVTVEMMRRDVHYLAYLPI
jgi:hypothetical protein